MPIIFTILLDGHANNSWKNHLTLEQILCWLNNRAFFLYVRRHCDDLYGMISDFYCLALPRSIAHCNALKSFTITWMTMQWRKFLIFPVWIRNHVLTRMHSSRMHTVCCSGHLGGGGGVCLGRCLPRGRVCPGGCLPRGEQNDWQTGVKTLPFRNYCCGR